MSTFAIAPFASIITYTSIAFLLYPKVEDEDGNTTIVEFVKPYLFPLSSMTEKQKYEYDELIHLNNIKAIEGVITSTDCSAAEIDWLNANHFDYRGLIPKGLAIDATGLNIY